MAELLLELYSEEIPPQLQIAARSQIKIFIENTFKEENIKYKELSVYSSPTRLTLFIKDLAEKIKIEAKEIKGPKVGSPDQVIYGFLKAKNVFQKDLSTNCGAVVTNLYDVHTISDVEKVEKIILDRRQGIWDV